MTAQVANGLPLVREVDGALSVRRRVYRDPDVLAREREKIFRKCWLFLGHESEIPEPGDYVLRRLGVDPVVVVRDENGVVRVHLNTCRHRGVRLCRSDQGNASHFRCPYHGWTYANTGALVGVTNVAEVFGGDFDKGSHGLLGPACVDSVFGLIFANWDSETPTLQEYLGDALWYLESIFNKWEKGVEVIGPPIRTLIPSDWKPETENLGGDGYHTPITHQSAFVLGMFASKEELLELGEMDGKPYVGRVAVCGNGHTFRVHQMGIKVPRNSFFGYPETWWASMESRLDEGQRDVQSRLSVLHGNIFPNLTILENFKTSTEKQGGGCRYIRLTQQLPIGPGHNEMLWWGFVPRGAGAEWRGNSQNAYIRTVGPAGLFQIDDTENYVSLTGQAGPVLLDSEFMLEGGLGNEFDTDVKWRGTVYRADKTEQTMRSFWRRWAELMDIDIGVAASSSQ
jgi:phenylpropionate dioxygenase-like ring-hydroxylating dioxygenase large terminal subunit